MAARGLALVLATAVAVVGGCVQTSEGPTPREPPLDATVLALDPLSVDPHQIDFPLDPWTRDADLDVLGRATDVLQQRCFRRFGLDLPLPEYEVQPPIPSWDWYGLWDEETARVYGYESPPLRASFLLADVPPEWDAVLGGEVETFNGEEVPEGGCQGEADRMLGTDDDSGLVSVDGLQRDAVNRARQHSGVEALIHDWSACLADAGWEADDPADPFGRWQGTGSGYDRTPEELEMALADIACKKETGLLRAWVAAEVAYQRILVEENAEALRELERWREEAKRKANQVLAGGS